MLSLFTSTVLSIISIAHLSQLYSLNTESLYADALVSPSLLRSQVAIEPSRVITHACPASSIVVYIYPSKRRVAAENIHWERTISGSPLDASLQERRARKKMEGTKRVAEVNEPGMNREALPSSLRSRDVLSAIARRRANDRLSCFLLRVGSTENEPGNDFT